MANKPPETGYFVTATDTGMGKTLITSGMIREFRQRGFRVAGFKPVATGAEIIDGCLVNEDGLSLMQASEQGFTYTQINPYCFAQAAAPHIVAAKNNCEIELQDIEDARDVLAASTDMVIVEGVGGWKVPLGKHLDLETIARVLNYPVIMVVGLKLGCINHSLLTVDAILESDGRLTGWVTNEIDPDYEEQEETIKALIERVPAPYLGNISFQNEGTDKLFSDEVRKIVDVLCDQAVDQD